MYSESCRITDEYIRYILETYSAPIIKLCYTYVRSKEDAEDIAQDVFVEMMQKNMMFDVDSKEYEKAWLMRTAINKCKNYLKTSRVRMTVPLEDDYKQNDEALENIEKLDNTVLRAVMALPEKYRTPIHLYYISGYSIKEISSVTGVSTATVGTRLARGREALKKLLKGEIDL